MAQPTGGSVRERLVSPTESSDDYRPGCELPLYSWSLDSDHAPTQGMRERGDELLAELARRESEMGNLRAGELATLEQAVQAAGLPRVILPGS